jgi:hypothetical protein
MLDNLACSCSTTTSCYHTAACIHPLSIRQLLSSLTPIFGCVSGPCIQFFHSFPGRPSVLQCRLSFLKSAKSRFCFSSRLATVYRTHPKVEGLRRMQTPKYKSMGEEAWRVSPSLFSPSLPSALCIRGTGRGYQRRVVPIWPAACATCTSSPLLFRGWLGYEADAQGVESPQRTPTSGSTGDLGKQHCC